MTYSHMVCPWDRWKSCTRSCHRPLNEWFHRSHLSRGFRANKNRRSRNKTDCENATIRGRGAIHRDELTNAFIGEDLRSDCTIWGSVCERMLRSFRSCLMMTWSHTRRYPAKRAGKVVAFPREVVCRGALLWKRRKLPKLSFEELFLENLSAASALEVRICAICIRDSTAVPTSKPRIYSKQRNINKNVP